MADMLKKWTDNEADVAPDGTRDALKSGRWPALEPIPISAFPDRLLLTESDARLSAKSGKEIVLASARVGGHKVELLLVESGTDGLAMAMRVPTAANQYREPYVLMEAEHGNTREDALRDFHFHLFGRVAETEILATDWAHFFDAAADRLDALRARA